MGATSRIVTAIVTGGASGLGRATALRLAGRGMGVVVADVRQETPFEHDNIRYVETDVRTIPKVLTYIIRVIAIPADCKMARWHSLIQALLQVGTHTPACITGWQLAVNTSLPAYGLLIRRVAVPGEEFLKSETLVFCIYL